MYKMLRKESKWIYEIDTIAPKGLNINIIFFAFEQNLDFNICFNIFSF